MKIVISEFMDAPAVASLAATFDVVYDKDLVDQPIKLKASLANAAALIVRNRTLVNAALGQTACCADGASTACNQPWYLDRALQRTGNLNVRTSGPVGWERIRSEIDAGRPVGARIGWSGGGGHFVLLTGYRSAGKVREVDVQDPFTGRSTLPLDQFSTRYKSTGTWTHTYLTRS